MNPKSNQSTSTKLQRRINELYDDKQGCKPLDRGLFPAVMAPFGPGDAMKMLRWSLGQTVGAAFAANLRVHIACLYNVLSDADVDEPARTQDHDRLRASMCEAIAHIEAWTERHGIKVCGTLVEDAAALRGWPDKTGHGWTPPWDMLAIDRPHYWATGSG